VLRPEINEATVRVLTRQGCEVVVAKGAGSCGAVFHQLGIEERAKAAAKPNIAAWSRVIEEGGLDAIIFNASGCGVALKDYAHLLRDDPKWEDRAARVSALCRYVSEVLVDIGLKPAVVETGHAVTYHLACTM
jgi:glycolate oxidase iron-sulfur subunit